MRNHRRCRNIFPLEVIVMMTLVVVAVISLVASIYVGGQSFGQRCKRVYPENSNGYNLCIQRISHPSRSIRP